MSISEQLNNAMRGMYLLIFLGILAAMVAGVAIGKSQVKTCTKNNQCRILEPDRGFVIKLSKQREGEVYVWGSEN